MTSPRLMHLFLAVIVSIAPAAAEKMDAQPPCEEVASIGVATMAADGTITLQVRSLPPGPVGYAKLVYAPSHPQYQAILKHIGGLAPGESRPVPPWC